MQTTFSPYRVLLSGALLLTALLSTFVLLGLMTHPAQAAMPTYVGGPITTNTTWTATNSPYILTETVAIMAGVTLTVEPGVTVMGFISTYLHFAGQGHLYAVGTPDNPITFTAENGVPGGWEGISGWGSATFKYVTIDKSNINLLLWGTQDGNVQIEDSVLSNGAKYAIETDINTLHRLQMSNVLFVNNAKNRVLIQENNSDLIGNTTLTLQPGLEGYEFRGFSATVLEGITLTVEPGVTLLFLNNWLGINGYLEAIGTPDSPITFTKAPEATDGWHGIGVTGHLMLKNVIIDGADRGIYVWGHSSVGNLQIEDSIISNSVEYPIDLSADVLHHLQMSNVSFVNNVKNRILVKVYYFPLGNTTLTSQPGLEGYEIQPVDQSFEIPVGIMLTIEPGVTLLFPEELLYVYGHLEAVGTADSPITFTGVPEGPSTGAWGGIGVIGSANFNYVTIDKASWSFGVWEAKGGNVQIENSTISNSSDYPMTIEVPALHRVNMLNVSFVNNITNRVLIEAWNEDSLTNNVTLFPQPGLEGYEFKTNTTEIAIPEGITLTIKPGATLLFSDEWTILEIRGHLEAVGTQENPITFTSFLEMPVQDWALEFEGGSGYLRYVHLHHNTITVWQNYSLDRQVIIENSSIQDSDWYAIDITSDSLHSLALSNVTFTNNYTNRVLIYTDFTPSTLIADVTLSPQPGLEAYEITENPYPRDGGLVVPPGLTMTVEPGVTLMQAEYVLPLRVEGTLQALGTAVSPITFTSATNSAAGEWAGIVVSGTADFAHTTVRYAQTGVTVAGGAVTAVCSTFTNNLADGVYVDSTGSPNVNLSASGIFGNGGWNLFNNNSTQVDARYNWWGSPSDPASTINGNVLYTPWLTEPTCPAPPPIYHLSLPLVLAP